MKLKQLTQLLMMMALVIGLTACSDDKINESTVTVVLNAEENGLSISSGIVTFKNVTTGVEQDVDYSPAISVSLVDGLYNVSFSGEGIYEDLSSRSGALNTVKVQGAQQNVEVLGGVFSLNLKVYMIGYAEAKFVISEVFFAGTYMAGTQKQYNGDQYIRIHNNSSETLYADGLVIMESQLSTTVKDKDYVSAAGYESHAFEDSYLAKTVFMLPGSGTDYPIAPGESFVVCDNAQNHTEANAASFDHSKAKFEWYNESTSTALVDVDNPQVPNVDIVYGSTATILVLDKKGIRTYAIGKLGDGVSKADFIDDYFYRYDYTIARTGTAGKTQTCYRFPYEWLYDAVNISSSTEFLWSFIPANYDMSYTYAGESSTVSSTVGKAVVRKVISSDDETGAVFYLDNNDSAKDFIPAATPTLLK